MKDKLRFIPIHTVATKLGEEVCCLLPAFHALTGCDTTSGLYQIGKRKAWKAIHKNFELYGTIAGLGDNEEPSAIVAKMSESFISSIYAPPSRAGTSADGVR